MIGRAVALGLAAAAAAMAGPAAPEATDLAIRMRASAAAAQALQGPLDGTWTLWEGDRPLYLFQITDPPGGAGPLGGAWRGTGASVPAGLVDVIARRGNRLTIRFTAGGEIVRVRVRRGGGGVWTGRASENGHDLTVTLRRTASGSTRQRGAHHR